MRQRVAGVLIVLISVTAIAVIGIYPLFLGTGPDITEPVSFFQYEETRDSEFVEPVTVNINDFSNCNVSVSFSTNSSLLYSFNLTLNEPAYNLSSVMHVLYTEDSIYFEQVNNENISEFHLVLNSYIPINLKINNGVDLQADVVYSNGANLTGVRFDFYESTGNLSFTMDSSVVLNSDDLFYMRVGQGGNIWPTTLNLDVTLPSDIYGWNYLQAEGNLTPIAINGWLEVEEHDCVNIDVYATAWLPYDPQIKFRTMADTVFYSLSIE